MRRRSKCHLQLSNWLNSLSADLVSCLRPRISFFLNYCLPVFFLLLIVCSPSLGAPYFRESGLIDIPTGSVVGHGVFGIGTYSVFRNEDRATCEESEMRFDFGLFDRVEIGLSSVPMKHRRFLLSNVKLLLLREGGTLPSLAVGIENIGDEAERLVCDLKRYERNSTFLVVSKTFSLPRVHQFSAHIGIGNHRFTEEIGIGKVLHGVFSGLSKDIHPRFANGELTFSIEVDGRGLNAGVRHTANSGLQIHFGAEALNGPATDGKDVRYIAGVSWSNRVGMKRVEAAKRLAKQAGILANEAKKVAQKAQIEAESKKE